MKCSLTRAPFQTKGRIFSRNGMVVTAHPLATLEAVRVLYEGGNAFDATVTAAMMTGVLLPGSCGLGGDAFAVVYSPRTGKVEAVNGAGTGQNCTREDMLERGYDAMPVEGALSIGLPGSVDACRILWERYGSLPLSRLLEPAIRYAREGFLLGEVCASKLTLMANKISHDSDAAAIFLKSGPKGPGAGGLLVQSHLADSLEQLARKGFRDLYEGELAEAIVESLSRKGALFTMDNFRSHKSEFVPPLCVRYRGHDVYATNLPSQGLIMLEELRILEGFPLSDYGHNSTRSIHTMVEAKKLAFADRLRFAGDPRFIDVPLDSIFSDEHIASRRAMIRPDHSMTKDEFNSLLPERDGDTTSFSITDRFGNAVSYIHSISNRFGSGVVAGDTGILLNNRAGRGFNLIKGSPNCLAPGKRTMSTLMAHMILRDGKPCYLLNTAGGDNQPQWNMQITANLLDYGLNEEQAVCAPRWYSYPGTDPEHFSKPFRLVLEQGVPELSAYELEKLGHNVEIVGHMGTAGGEMVIGIHDNGFCAGCDTRVDSLALGF